MIVTENVIGIAFTVALAGLTVSSFCFRISFTLTIQSGFTILDPNFDHGVYMSVRHVLPDLYFIFMDYWFVKFMSNFHDKVSSFISLKPRLSIFGTYIDHGEYWSVSHIITCLWVWSLLHGLLILFNIHKDFVIRSVSIQPRFTIFGPHMHHWE